MQPTQKAARLTSVVLLGAMTIEIRPYKSRDEISVVQLKADCGLVVPWNNSQRDIHRKLEAQPEMFLVGSLADEVIATDMAEYDRHRG